MRLKKTIALCLSMLTAFSFVACGVSEGKNDDNSSLQVNTGKAYETSANNDVETGKALSTSARLRKKYGSYWTPQTDYKTMPIGAYNGLPPSGSLGFDYDYEQVLSDYNELGVNYLFGLYNSANQNLEHEKTTLSLCDEYNISYLSKWNSLHWETESSLQNQKAILEELTKYESFMGPIIVDEPGKMAFQGMATARDAFEKVIGANANDYLYHVNLLPNWAGCEPLYNFQAKNPESDWDVYKNYTYNQYLTDYMQIYNPQVLSYDFYPMVGAEKELKDGYFENLSVIREKALEANIPFWTFVQTCAWDFNQRLPSKEELLWNVNTCLAYGAKGIEYFCGVEPWNSTSAEHFSASLFYKDGSHVPVVYDSALLANKQIQAIDEVLMCSKSKGVIFVGDTPALSNGTNKTMTPSTRDVLKSYNELTSASAFHALIGCFYYEGKTALYVVNNSVSEADAVNLQFNKAVQGTYTQGATKKTFSGDTLRLTLEAGDGVLVVLD